MSERRKIEERIRKKELELQELEIQVREGRVYIQALQDVLKMLPKEAKDSESVTEGPIALREGSLASMARDAIMKIGKPAHVSELLAEMDKDDTRENRTSLSGTLAAYVRKREIFTRPAPNRFGLIELGHTPKKGALHPPDDFGEMSDS